MFRKGPETKFRGNTCRLRSNMLELFSHCLGIDFGVVNTTVYVRDHGIVLRELTVVAGDKGDRADQRVREPGCPPAAARHV
jgi:hypothetical protein